MKESLNQSLTPRDDAPTRDHPIGQDLREQVAEPKGQIAMLLQQQSLARQPVPDQIKAGPMEIERVRPQQPNRDPDDPHAKNPCECEHCTPFKVRHWYCSSCGRGPFRFEKTDPGRAPMLYPPYIRTLQRYMVIGHYTDREGVQVPVQEWVRWSRYGCSPACVAMEKSAVMDEQWAQAAQKPKLAAALSRIAAAARAQEMVASGAGDDLSP